MSNAEEVCILCERIISEDRKHKYTDNYKKYIQTPTFQPILDTLIDHNIYNYIYFVHAKELGDIYRGIAKRKQSQLQYGEKKGRDYHKKWADITAGFENSISLIVEDETDPSIEKIIQDIELTQECDHVWVDGRALPIKNCIQFVTLDIKDFNWPSQKKKGQGAIDHVIICDKKDFPMYYKHIVIEGNMPAYPDISDYNGEEIRKGISRDDFDRKLESLHPREIALLDVLCQGHGDEDADIIIEKLSDLAGEGTHRSLSRIRVSINKKYSPLELLPPTRMKGSTRYFYLDREFIDWISEWVENNKLEI